jgi:hypothetical protein
MLTHEVQKDSQTLEDADVQERQHSHAAELTEEELQHLTVFNEPTQDNNVVVQTPLSYQHSEERP